MSGTKAPSGRSWCRARATSSLPVPDSPPPARRRWRGDPGDQRLELAGLGAVADQGGREQLAHLPTQQQVLPLHLAALDDPVHRLHHLIQVEGFENEVAGAEPQRLEGGLHVAETGHEDDVAAPGGGIDGLVPLDAGAPRQADVGDDEIEMQAAAQGLGLLHAGGVSIWAKRRASALARKLRMPGSSSTMSKERADQRLAGAVMKKYLRFDKVPGLSHRPYKLWDILSLTYQVPTPFIKSDGAITQLVRLTDCFHIKTGPNKACGQLGTLLA